MKNLLKLLLVLVSVSFISAKDCCKGDGSDKITTIKWIKAHQSWAADDKHVVVIGKVVKKGDEDTYFLEDGTGRIELDSDIKLPVGKQIVVHGNIDYAFLGERRTQLNVTSWRLSSTPGRGHHKTK